MIMPTEPLSYYQALLNPEPQAYSLTLTQEEAAVVLKAHDNGIEPLTEEERLLVERVLSTLAQTIRP